MDELHDGLNTPLLQLCESLHDQSAAVLQKKLNLYLQTQTEAETACLILVSDNEEEFVCQVIGDQQLEEIKFPCTNNSLSTALKTKSTITQADILPLHLTDLETRFDRKIASLMVVPVVSQIQAGHTVLLVCLINKQGQMSFTNEDAQVVDECFRYTQSILLNTLAYEDERRLRLQCQSLLTVARNLFTHLDDVTLLLREIMTDARNLTKAERCSLFLLDRENNELVAKVFDGNLADDGFEHPTEVRIPASEGIAGHVATTDNNNEPSSESEFNNHVTTPLIITRAHACSNKTLLTLGELINIHDAYSHPLFYREMDKTTGFKTRNILCFPIKDDKGVIGVAELCNKLSGLYFSTFDEQIAMAFSIYCGISIMHSLMWKKVRDAQHRSKLSNELMMYHMKQVSDEDVKALSQSKEIPAPCTFHKDFSRFCFLPRNLPEQETPLVVLCMMEDLGFISRWRISRDTLARFVLMVRKGYRDPPYHNWIHAFSVAHFCFLLLKNLGLKEKGMLTEIECLALFVACLCHDLDHRGTNNSFQVVSKSVLAHLYSSEGSVMERHHLAQAMCILNTEGCNVFESLSRKDYTTCLDTIRDIILATDLAHHLRIFKEIRDMIKGGYNVKDQKHHSLLLCLLMTSCDLSDQTKDWKSSKKIAELVYREFFSQGDLEKAMGNRPLEMMDREKACIPELQINFISQIVLPVYELLEDLFSAAHVTTEAVDTNRRYWERMRDVYRRRYTSQTSSLDIFDDEELDNEVVSSLSSSCPTVNNHFFSETAYKEV